MSCFKCPKCGYQCCDIEECPMCLKRKLHTKKMLSNLNNATSGTYESDSDYKGYIKEDI